MCETPWLQGPPTVPLKGCEKYLPGIHRFEPHILPLSCLLAFSLCLSPTHKLTVAAFLLAIVEPYTFHSEPATSRTHETIRCSRLRFWITVHAIAKSSSRPVFSACACMCYRTQGEFQLRFRCHLSQGSLNEFIASLVLCARAMSPKVGIAKQGPCTM